jgi:hypothetical protein
MFYEALPLMALAAPPAKVAFQTWSMDSLDMPVECCSIGKSFPTILTLVYPDFVHAEKYNKYGHITHVFTIIF